MFLVDIVLIATTTAVACSSLGLFLVLKGIALMSDAISHTVIFGIVSAYLIFKTFNSVILAIGAMCTGIITVWLTELLISTEKVYKEVAVGLVFPLLFSIGSLLICQYTSSLHLDVDMVLLGEIALTTLKRFSITNIDCGPWFFWFMLSIMTLNLVFITLLYRPLQLSIFDPCTAQIYTMHPTALYYGLILLASLTIVSALEVVGSLVAVALMIIPAATALLDTHHTTTKVFYTTILYSVISAIIGCLLGFYMDISIGGSIAVSAGMLFFSKFIVKNSLSWTIPSATYSLRFSKK
jgi:manganese/zinc/iron transport system permease protein